MSHRYSRNRLFVLRDALKRISVVLVVAFTFLILTAHIAHGQDQSCETCKPLVPVDLQASVCSGENVPVNIAGVTATASGVCTLDQWMTSNTVSPQLKPDQPYVLTVGPSSGMCSVHINFSNIPDKYKLEIDGKETTTIDKSDFPDDDPSSATWTVVLRKCPCANEDTDGDPGEDNLQLGSVIWELGLGRLANGRSAEKIALREQSLSPSSYTPSALVYAPPGFTSEVDVVLNSTDNSLRQVKAPQTLADIVVISSSEYDIRFYRPADVGSKVNGVYSVSGQPFVIWKVKNPDPSSLTRIQISKTPQGGITDTSEYIWDINSGTWSLSTGGGARVESRTVTYPTPNSRTETTTVKNSSGQLVSKIARTYNNFPWGEQLVQDLVDPDGAALKTTYVYYGNIAEANHYSRLKSVTNPDGSWEQYDYDGSGNKTLVLRPWKDLALASATEANSYATYYTYSNTDGIEVSLNAKLISSVIEKIAGVTVRKTTYARSATTINGEPAVTEVQTGYSSATATQASSTTTYHSSASVFLANRVASMEYADGRKDTYTYEKGTYTANADPSLSTFTPDVNGIAQRDTVVHGTTVSPNGVAFKSTKETTIRDQYGQTVLQESYIYNGTDYERFGWSAMDYDDRGHLIQTRRHTGQVTSSTWNGDKEIAEFDETGIETDYTYDSLNRVQTETKKGVAASGSFPAQADIVTTFGYDVEGRQTSQTVASEDGSLSLTKSRTYDTAGRLKSENNEAGLITSHTYANGGRTETVTLPGGATQVASKYLDGQSKSVTGTATVTQFSDYGVNGDGTRYTQVFIGSAGLSSPRWTKNTVDWLRRIIEVEKPTFTGTNLIQTSTYNNQGQLQSETSMAGSNKLLADKLYEYDELGNQTRSGLDVDASGGLILLSTDRITEASTSYEKVGSDWFRVTSKKAYLTDNNDTATTQTQRERLNNFTLNGTDQTVSETTLIDVAGNNTKTTISVDRAAKKTTATTDTPDSDINAVSITVNGLLQSSTPTAPQSVTTYIYDALGRQTSTIDPRTGTTTKGYSATTGQLISTNVGAGTTSYEYYPTTHVSAGRLKSQTNAAGKKIYFNYSARGEMIQTWGDTNYPLEYVYDGFGQRTEQHTFRGGQSWSSSAWPASLTGAADVTKWIYQDATGLLTQKQDATLKGATYTYDELGRNKTRTWARSITCTYGYDQNTGELRNVTYSDSTPAVAFTYDRGGRQTNITDAAGAHTRTFNVAGEFQTDQISGGILDGISVNVGFDSFLRRNSLQTSQGANTLSSQAYGYDSNSRLQTVTSGSQTATYVYYSTSGLLNSTSFTGGTNIVRVYDTQGRIQTITNTPAADAAQSYAYTYNNLNQRTRVTREDGSYWSYVYNDRGELVSGKKYWSDNSIVWGAQTEYNFDNIGSRSSAKNGGNQLGSLRQSSYTTNSLNQYSQRTVPGAVDINGAANASATVSVNNQSTARRIDYFYKELAVDNSTAPAYPQINIVGARNSFGPGGEDAVTQKGGRVFVPPAIETFVYDDDGNLSSDGRWNYTWDAENRLTSVEALPTVPTEAKLRLEFAYDYMARRIQKKVYGWNVSAGGYQLQSTTKFVYDGWNLVAELDANNALIRSYVRGSELLLINGGGNNYQVGHDGNENLRVLVKAATGTISASYDYDSFGQTLKAVGEYAGQNPVRFSGQYSDSESGLIYYGYRYYNPSIARWLGRDPISESGGTNLYGFVENNPVSFVDLLGAKSFSEYAEEKMWDLFQHHDDEVGSEFPGDKQGRKDTNCTIYVTNVLEYAFEKTGRKDIAKRIHAMKQASGVQIGELLLSLGWKAHYWNPDVREPRNDESPVNPKTGVKIYGIKEHTSSYQYALKTHTYAQGHLTLSGFIVNYGLTSHRTRTVWGVTVIPNPLGVPGAVPVPYPDRYTPQDNIAVLNRFKQVRFAFLTSLSGWHNFLYSFGYVFEVHWTRQRDDLYQRSPFETWGGYANGDLSGAAIIPPDTNFVSDPR
jgi:RHS repeat-associated protein